MALVISGSAFAQIPQEAQMTQAQKDNTKRVEKRVAETNLKVNQELDAITSAITVSHAEKEAIAEIVTSKISGITKLDSQNLIGNAKATQVTSIMNKYKEELSKILGAQRFALIENLIK